MARTAPNRQSTEFARWLDAQLRRHELNQSGFAKKVGVSTSTVSRWMGDRLPEAAYADRIADALGADTDRVLGLIGIRPPTEPIKPDDPKVELIDLIKRADVTRYDRAKQLALTIRGWIEYDRSHPEGI